MRRDLRLENYALIDLCKKCDKVYLIFILDDEQINPKKNKYFSINAFHFMLDSLKELQPLLHITKGNPVKVIKKYIKSLSIDIVAFNRDYTPYALARDDSIGKLCDEMKISLLKYDDICLNSPDTFKPYQIFTPYYTVAKKIPVRPCVKFTNDKIIPLSNKINLNDYYLNNEHLNKKSLIQRGGRSEGMKLLNSFDSTTYKKRDQLSYETSRLSPHLKFGTISPYEVYHKCKSSLFRKQLYWRDFYMQIAYNYDVFGKNFKHKIKWSNNYNHFEKWCEGNTGYDIVDAAMRQLNTTGFMHNRARMIVASFLTKILHIDWRLGEKYFASKLTDYDPINNNGGWQWSAGTGVDAAPYFRIFNPQIQADKFDANYAYRNKYLSDSYKKSPPKKIVSYEEERAYAFKIFQ